MLVDCKCKSLQRLGENICLRKKKKRKEKYIKKQKENKKQKRTRRKTIQTQKYIISSPRTSANKSHKMFVVLSVSLCVRLVVLRFCIYNRKKHIHKHCLKNKKNKNKKNKKKHNNSKKTTKKKNILKIKIKYYKEKKRNLPAGT